MGRSNQHTEIEELENAFWKSIVDADPKVATHMLHEPALMVTSRGVYEDGKKRNLSIAQLRVYEF